MRNTPLKVIGHAASVWIVSSILFYLVLPMWGINLSYNTAPIAISIFYAFWVGVAVIVFFDIYRRHLPTKGDVITEGLLSAVFAVFASLFLWLFSYTTAPHLLALEPVTDLLLATPWYFLPKSVEILFQQMLIAVLVFALCEQSSLRTTIVVYGGLFGGAHLLLFFGGTFPPAVLIMTLAAVTSAAFFPYLLMRVRHGFLYCYMIHWVFYATLAVLLRVSSS